MVTLTDHFQTNLRAEKAVSKKQKDDAHRIRFSVYCSERGYEDASRFPDQLESDEYDKGSVHAIVRHRKSDHPLGVVRLVLPDQLNPERLLPIEQHFGHAFEQSTMRKFDFSRHEIAEVSRFAISQQSLKHVSQHVSTASQPSKDSLTSRDRQTSKQLIPHISLGLIAMLFSVSHQHQINYWYAAMEPSLSRLLTRLGIKFTPIGPIMNYHGRRQPMIAKVNDLLTDIYHERSDFFHLIREMGGTRSFDEQLPLDRLAEARGIARTL